MKIGTMKTIRRIAKMLIAPQAVIILIALYNRNTAATMAGIIVMVIDVVISMIADNWFDKTPAECFLAEWDEDKKKMFRETAKRVASNIITMEMVMKGLDDEEKKVLEYLILLETSVIDKEQNHSLP